jgi:hypothetical protein
MCLTVTQLNDLQAANERYSECLENNFNPNKMKREIETKARKYGVNVKWHGTTPLIKKNGQEFKLD